MFVRRGSCAGQEAERESGYNGQVYYTLKPAISYAMKMLPLWALDKPVDPSDAKAKGKKQYYCCGYRKFFERILLPSSPADRCFYELVSSAYSAPLTLTDPRGPPLPALH